MPNPTFFCVVRISLASVLYTALLIDLAMHVVKDADTRLDYLTEALDKLDGRDPVLASYLPAYVSAVSTPPPPLLLFFYMSNRS